MIKKITVYTEWIEPLEFHAIDSTLWVAHYLDTNYVEGVPQVESMLYYVIADSDGSIDFTELTVLIPATRELVMQINKILGTNFKFEDFI